MRVRFLHVLPDERRVGGEGPQLGRGDAAAAVVGLPVIAGFMDLALKAMGASRIVYSTDIFGRSIPSQVSRVVACDLSERDRERSFWHNGAEVLGDRLPARWQKRFAQ